MQPLAPHPQTPRSDLAIEAGAVREGRVLRLRYVLRGVLEALRLPGLATPRRVDGLWRHTCLEAFVRGVGHDGYLEFNLAPSTEWAAYRFDGYRAGMAPAPLTPAIEVARTDDLELRAEIDLTGCGLDGLDWRVGLSAVIEAADGGLSYWALGHPAGKPDFHNGDCFALELPGSREP